MSICTNCSKEIPDQANNCPYCGAQQNAGGGQQPYTGQQSYSSGGQQPYTGQQPPYPGQQSYPGQPYPGQPYPGQPYPNQGYYPGQADSPTITFSTLILLCWFLGGLGVHRFVTGKIVSGIIMLITLGGLGIWTFVDFILIFMEKFTDKNGVPVKRDRLGTILGIVFFCFYGIIFLLVLFAIVAGSFQQYS
jgi:hypothetical protein